MISTSVRSITLLAILLCTTCTALAAAAPNPFSLELRLTTAAGVPVTNPAQAITLKLYTVSAGGAAAYTESQTVSVSNGLCATTIGGGNPVSFAALPFSIAYWVGVTVGTDAEMTPRLPLLAVPYAAYARSVADNAIGTAQIANGTLTAADFSGGVLTPGGAAGGDLSGTYPNPMIGNARVTAAKLALDIGSIDKVTENRLQFFDLYWLGEYNTSANSTGSLDMWQSFTPSTSGYLRRVGFSIGSTGASSYGTTLRVFSGEGIGGTQLRSQAIAVQPTLATQYFTLTNPVILSSGTKYTVALATAANSQIRYSTTNPYSGGRADLNANYDYYFLTYTSPFPEGNELNVDTYTTFDNGIYSTSASNHGVYGRTTKPGYAGIYGYGPTDSYAGHFNGAVRVSGDLHVTGTLTKAAGSFKIDHPLDPGNKTLSHSFVESPDMMNIYNGNVTTDAEGRAEVELPEWFSALNKDYRYQLTCIGQFAQAIVSKKVRGNRFSIRTDKPNVEVSWQITGVRDDAYARAHRIPTEEPKPKEARGTYLFPEGFQKLLVENAP
jgi:hypothetical protein